MPSQLVVSPPPLRSRRRLEPGFEGGPTASAGVENGAPPPRGARRGEDGPRDAGARGRAGGDGAPVDLPVEASLPSRARLRRGGPRTPLPLLPLIAVGTGIAIAYVAQTAHVTQASYEATQLEAQQSQLRQQDSLLGEELDQLTAASRIDAAAQHLGLRPPAAWAYVPAPTGTTVDVPPAPGAVPSPSGGGDAVQKLVAIIRGEFGPAEADAAGP